MLKKGKSLAALILFFCSQGYAYPTTNVIEVYNDCASPSSCQPCCPWAGIYFEVNLGESWFTSTIHTPEVSGLPGLNANRVRLHQITVIPAVGYDFYPNNKAPVRVEVNFLYADKRFNLTPLFDDTVVTFSNNNLRLYNTMATLYFDWHSCCPVVPYMGVSIGRSTLKTAHDFTNDTLSNVIGRDSQSNLSWGATVGARVLLPQHFYLNAQYRFNELKGARFRNDVNPLLPQGTEFQADYVHESTIMLGIGYEL